MIYHETVPALATQRERRREHEKACSHGLYLSFLFNVPVVPVKKIDGMVYTRTPAHGDPYPLPGERERGNIAHGFLAKTPSTLAFRLVPLHRELWPKVLAFPAQCPNSTATTVSIF